jgi:diamine N-acetyltransferase
VVWITAGCGCGLDVSVTIHYLQEKYMVELKAITEDNFIDAFNLKLASGQERFVSHPIRSLAQAYVYRNQCQPFGIYVDGTMVGYVMVIYDYDIPEYDIWHMMIDESMQGKGIGREALNKVIEYIRTKPFGNSGRIALTCNKDNPIAKKLYESKGFSATGVEDEDELELVLTGE